MLGRKFPSPAIRPPLDGRIRRRLLWVGLILAAILAILVAAPPTRTEVLPWTGTIAA